MRSIGAPREEGARKSFFSRLGRAFVGRTEERLVRPTAVAEKDGELFIADPGAPALHILNLKGNSYRRVVEAGEEGLVSPVGIAVGGGRIYLADSYLRRIFVFETGGRFVTSFGAKELERPTGLAFDERAKTLFVADTSAHRIALYDEMNHLIKYLGSRGSGEGELNYPTCLCLDDQGYLYVVDSLNYRVQIFDGKGAPVSTLGRHGDGSGDFASPKGIGVDHEGHLYVVDALFDTVQIFDPMGRLLLAFGERGRGSGQFWLPGGLAVGGEDRIYVADSYNRRVQIFELVGTRGNGS